MPSTCSKIPQTSFCSFSFNEWNLLMISCCCLSVAAGTQIYLNDDVVRFFVSPVQSISACDLKYEEQKNTYR